MKQKFEFTSKTKISNTSLNFTSPVWSTTLNASTNSIRNSDSCLCTGMKQSDEENSSSKSNLTQISFTESENGILGTSETKDEKIRLNIGGVRYETYLKTLRKVANTRLSDLSTVDVNYDPVNNEYFFDRSPQLFDYILNFYRTGELHVPMSECGSAFSNELDFWKINEEAILACCWLTYSKFRDCKETLAQFDDLLFLFQSREELASKEENINYIERMKRTFWVISEYPFSCLYGRFYSALSIFFVILSLINVMFVSYRPWYIDATFIYDNNTKRSIMVTGYPSAFFKVSDFACAVYFTLEFFFRLLCCPSLILFIKSTFNWIELVTIIGIYVQLIPGMIDPKFACFDPAMCPTSFVRIVSILQLIRIIRLIKLFKNYTGMRVMVYTLKSSFRELCLIISLLISGVTVFGSLIYAAEGDPERVDGFSNIPISFWFAITTMTTVGFGDILPNSALGYIICSMCAVCGVLVVAFTVPVAVNNFTFFYTYAQSRLKHREALKLKSKKCEN